MHVIWENEGEQPQTRAGVVTAVERIKSITRKGAALLHLNRPPGQVVIDIFDGIAEDVEKCRVKGIPLTIWEGEQHLRIHSSVDGGDYAGS